MKHLTPELEAEIKNCIVSLRKGNAIVFPDAAGWSMACSLDQQEWITQIMQIASAGTAGILLPDISMLIRYVTEIPESLETLIEYSNRPVLFWMKNTFNVPSVLLNKEGAAAFRVAKDLFAERLTHGFGKPLACAIMGSETPTPSMPDGILKSHTYMVNLRKPQSSNLNNMVILESGPGNLIRFIRK